MKKISRLILSLALPLMLSPAVFADDHVQEATMKGSFTTIHLSAPDIGKYVDALENDMSASFETIIYEDLNKENNDRYEYLIPNVNFVKNLDNKTSLDGNFTFKTKLQ